MFLLFMYTPAIHSDGMCGLCEIKKTNLGTFEFYIPVDCVIIP